MVVTSLLERESLRAVPPAGSQSKAPNCDDHDWRCRRLGISPTTTNQSLKMEGNMIDAVLNVAIFAMLGLRIVGFGAWAHKRVP